MRKFEKPPVGKAAMMVPRGRNTANVTMAMWGMITRLDFRMVRATIGNFTVANKVAT